ncbi:hypothetical protein MN032_13240 [Agromyces atrinae]|uniref:hypothetical protein n=1 Tax=Agromyces atrinae TaxID=592376 RepID=UPI001F59AF4D|nr:hypothetical protein [Agromyces atrinae]MCI2958660.1 hypothetical protein [Agromyces atrinae]
MRTLIDCALAAARGTACTGHNGTALDRMLFDAIERDNTRRNLIHELDIVTNWGSSTT